MVRQDCDRLNVLINNAGVGSGGALSAKGVTVGGLQLPLQGLSAFLRSSMVNIDDRARRGF
jgi:hypothetical protein